MRKNNISFVYKISFLLLFLISIPSYSINQEYKYWMELSNQVMNPLSKAACLMKALQFNPIEYKVYVEVGDILDKYNELDKAIEYYLTAKKILSGEIVTAPELGQFEKYLPVSGIYNSPVSATAKSEEQILYEKALQAESLLDKKILLLEALKINPDFTKANEYFVMLRKYDEKTSSPKKNITTEKIKLPVKTNHPAISSGIVPSDEPLGEPLTVFQEGLGPYGSSAVISPGASGRGSRSIGIGLGFVKLGQYKAYQMPVFLNYGLSDVVDITFGIPYVAIKSKTNENWGLGDFFAGIKYSPLSENLNYSVCLGIVCPSGDEEIFGNDNGIDFTFDVPFEFKLPNAVLNVSVGKIFMDMGKTDEDQIFKAGCSLSKSFTKKVGGSIEFSLSNMNSQTDVNGYLGLKYNINRKTKFNLILGTQLDDDVIDIDSIIVGSLSRSF